MKFIFNTVVWGEYVEDWLNQLLRFQKFQLEKEDFFTVCTDNETVKKIEDHEEWRHISEICKTDLIVKEHNEIESKSSNKYHVLAAYNRLFIDKYCSEDHCLSFLSPDVGYSELSLTSGYSWDTCKRKILSGKKALTLPMFRANKRKVLNSFNNHTTLYSKELIRTSLKHLHTITESLLWNSKNFNENWSSCLFWESKNGLIGRCWHQQPFMVVVSSKEGKNIHTVDSDLIWRSRIKLEDIEVLNDTEEVCAVELSEECEINPTRKTANVEKCVEWARNGANVVDRHLFKFPIYWLTDFSPFDMNTAIYSDNICNKIMELL